VIVTLGLPPHLAARAALRPRDLCEAFGVSKSKVRALIVAGRLDAVQLDGVCLIDRASVERWLASAKAAK
jgi:excisionase family DNA binding protein